MLVAITCPHCRHRGVIAKHKLPCSLKCSRCGQCHRFEREAALRGQVVSKQRQLEERRLSLWRKNWTMIGSASCGAINADDK
jgi:hypothetical protein